MLHATETKISSGRVGLLGSCATQPLPLPTLYFEALFVVRVYSDMNECTVAHLLCDVNANCINTRGSFYCSCLAGFTGNGEQCTGKENVLTIRKKAGLNLACVAGVSVGPYHRFESFLLFGLAEIGVSATNARPTFRAPKKRKMPRTAGKPTPRRLA